MKDLSLNSKVTIVLGLAFLTAIIIAAVGYSGVGQMKRLIDAAATETTPRLVNALSAQSEFRNMGVTQYHLMQADSREEMQEMEKELKESHEEFLKHIQSAKKVSSEEQMPKWNEFESLSGQWWEQSVEVQKAAIDKSIARSHELARKQIPLKKKAEAILDEVADANRVELSKEEEDTHTEYNHVVTTEVAVSVGGILISAVLAFIIMRAVSQSIAVVVQSLKDGSLQLTSASAQIAAASEELSQATTEQAASLEETAGSIDEMNSMISKNTESANSAALLSNKSSDISIRGKQVVERMIQSMNQIDHGNQTIMAQVTESNQQVAGIAKVIEQIAKKTQVINDIVNKTELLSFNASVEAARAGEHGKGFAVVAEEVGNLARMSGAAAEEIGLLIENSVENVKTIVQETGMKVGRLVEDSKKTVQEGTEVARECNDVLTEIVANVNNVSNMSGDIATASGEQARGIQEITKAIGQLDQMTQQNAATSEEAASSAEELSGQAEALKTTVIRLVTTIHGKSAQEVENTQYSVPGVKTQATKSQLGKFKSPSSLKTQKPASSHVTFKKVAGDIPSYDNEGFEEN